MSSILVVVIIVVLLVGLVCYALAAQTVARNREKRNRLLTALKSKSRTLKALLSGFPDDYLPRDISLLLQKNLLDVYEQLSRLEPKISKHKVDLQSISSQLSETQRSTRPEAPQSLDNLQQIKEVKLCLEELHKFVFKQEKRGIFSKSVADNYRSQIKQKLLELTMDTYTIHGTNAEQVGKNKLAVLQFDHAINLALKEGTNNTQVAKKVAKLRSKLKALQERMEQEEPQAPKPDSDTEDTKEAWQNFEEEESSGWKKKHAYD